jgi:hypothetical protein
MSTDQPLATLEVMLSYRQHPIAGFCCYVTATRVDNHGQSAVVSSQHLTGSPERLVDQAVARAFAVSLEHFLAELEPF